MKNWLLRSIVLLALLATSFLVSASSGFIFGDQRQDAFSSPSRDYVRAWNGAPYAFGDDIWFSVEDLDWNVSDHKIDADGNITSQTSFSVSPTTTDPSRTTIIPHVLRNGNILLVWYGSSSDDGLNDSYFKVITQAGSEVVAPTMINSTSGSSLNRFTQFAELSNGFFAFVYATDGSNYAMRRFRPDGSAFDTTQLSVTSLANVTSSQYTHLIKANNNGRFLISIDHYNATSYKGVLFEDEGTSPILVNGQPSFNMTQGRSNGSSNHTLDVLPDGRFLIAGRGEPAGCDSRNVHLRIWDDTGASNTANDVILANAESCWGSHFQPIITDTHIFIGYFHVDYNTDTYFTSATTYDLNLGFVEDSTFRTPTVSSAEYAEAIPFADINGVISWMVTDLNVSGKYEVYFLRNLSASANEPPSLTVPSTLTVQQDSTTNSLSGFSVTDADDDNLSVQLAVTSGQLTLSTTTGLSNMSGNATSSLSFTGSAANVTNALNGVNFQPAAGTWGSVTATVTVDDGENTAVVDTFTINVERLSFTVTFNLDGGSRTGGGELSQTVLYGNAASAPTLTPPTGKVFDAWDNDFSNIQSNLTVTALYEDIFYTVEFSLNGGVRTGGGELTQSIRHGTDAQEPVIERDGYTFNVWSAALTNITANQTINASWTVNNYDAIFIFNYGGAAAPTVVTQAFESTVNLISAPTRDIYDFAGWNTQADGGGVDYVSDFSMPLDGITLYAQWQLKRYDVRFYGWNDVLLITRNVEHGSAAVPPDTNPTRSGYDFNDWSVDFSNITAPLDVNATWTAKIYNVTWNFNYPEASAPAQTQQEFDAPVTLYSAPSRDSHSFKAWTVDEAGTGPELVNNFVYTEPNDSTYFAQWEINEYTVSFQDWDETPLTQEFVEHGSAAIGPTPTRTGYTFTGWSAAIDNITSDLTVTAEYDINIYDVTFLGVDDVVLEVQPVEFGSAAVAPDVPFTAGYLFQNWDVDFSEITDHLTVRAEFKRAFTVLNYRDVEVSGIYIESTDMVDGAPVFRHVNEEYTLTRVDSQWRLRSVQAPTVDLASSGNDTVLPTVGEWNLPNFKSMTNVNVQLYQPALSFSEQAFSTNNYVDELDVRGMLVTYLSLDGQGFDGVEDEDFVLTGKASVTGLPTGYRAELTFVDATTLRLRGFGTNSLVELNTIFNDIDVVLNDQAFISDDAVSVRQSSFSTRFAVHGYFSEIELTDASSSVQTMSVNLINLGRNLLNEVYTGNEFTSGDNTFAYVTQPFQVGASGDYLLGQTEAPVDTVLLLYRDEFDPLNPGENLISFNDDWTQETLFDTDWDRVWLRGVGIAGCGVREDRCPALQHSLEKDVNYVMVISHFSPSGVGSFELPQSFFVHGLGEPWFTRTVSLSAGDNGSVPASSVFARSDLPLSVEVIPDTGYQPASAVTGSCPAGTWAGNTYTINEVTADCSLGFSFEPASFTLTVDAQNGDAPVVSTVAFDSLVHLPTEPTRDWYNFVGWNSAADGAGSSYDADFTMPATDLTLYAQWQIQTFSVRFLDWDGSELVTRTVDAGSAAAAPTSPSRMGYTFVGWDVAFDEVYSSFDVTAQYNINTFTVRFLDWDGSVLSTQTVDWNTAATAPASPTRDGHTFTSWDVGFAAVTSNLDVTAQYDINTFTVRFLDWDDSVIATETVNWNEGATAPADPERDGYTFTGWSVAFDVITANLDVTAQYNINTFTVRFLDWDDSVIATETVNWNEGATAPADPTRELYEFIGWDRAFDAVTSDLDITAQYERNAFVVTATVITVDGFGVVTPMVQQVPRGGTATFEAWTSMRYRIRSVQSDCGVTFERSGRTFQFDDIRQDCEVVFEYRKVRSSIIRLLKAHGSVIQQQDDEMPENF